MKFYNLIIFIIIFFIKTGNVLSENTIFNVNNIIIEPKKYRNNQEFLDQAFKEGFFKLIERISLRKDYIKLKQTNLDEIKNLISHFQIQTTNKENLLKKIINIYFDKEKINNFFYKNNLTYSDFVTKKITVLPIQYINNDINVFSNNYFYQNWSKSEISNEKYFKKLDYILPIENLETINDINLSNKNYENNDLKKILSDYGNKDMALIHINIMNQKSKIFLQSVISGKKINKTFQVNNIGNTDEEKFYDIIIKNSKQEIEDIIKKENILDLRTPIFLNLNFKLKSVKDYKIFQNILEKMSVVESYEVKEINNESIKIKIKFYGKLKKFQQSLDEKKIIITIKDNQWYAHLR